MAGPIRIAVLANGSQARSELSKTAAAAEGIGQKFAKFRLPAAAALGGIAIGAKKAVDAASDLNEESSKSQVIFGANAKAIDKFASAAATKLGQSKRQALDAASTFGMIGQKAGLSGQETEKFATQFTGLASDLASFNNTSPEEAITAIGAAMRGESEPIRKYGVLLDDATLRSRALKEGLISDIKQGLTPQQKALAASKEILAQTTKAQGDFARTSKGAANAQRIAAARAENLKASLGKGLLPAYTGLLEVGNKFLSVMGKHPGVTKAVVVAVAALASIVLVASAATKVHAASLVIYTAVTKGITAVTKAWSAAQLALNIAMYLSPIGVVVLAIAAFVGIAILAYKKVAFFRAGVQAAWAGIKAATSATWNFVKGLISGVVKIVGTVIKTYFTIYKTIITGAWNVIKTATTALWNGFKTAVTGAVKFVRQTLAGFKNLVTGLFSGAGKWLLDAGKKIIGGLIDGIKNAIGGVKDVLGGVTKLIPDWKGPASVDKRLLFNNGRYIIGGLVDGFQQEIPAVERTLRGLTRRVSGFDATLGLNGGRVTAASALAAAATGNPTGRVIHIDKLVIEAGVGSSPEDIGREFVNYIKAYYEVGGARL